MTDNRSTVINNFIPFSKYNGGEKRGAAEERRAGNEQGGGEGTRERSLLT